MLRVRTFAVVLALLAAACAPVDSGPAPAPAPAAQISTKPPAMPTPRPRPRPVDAVAVPEAEQAVPPPTALPVAVAPAPATSLDLVPGDAVSPAAPTPAAEARTPWPPSLPPGLRLALRAPTHLAPSDTPMALAIEARLSNTAGSDARLTAATPCDVTDWILLDAVGAVTARKEPVLCAQVLAESVLRAGETLVARDQIEIPGKSLATGRYRLRYRFWGANAEAEIAVR
ncbi:hypothetical protein [Zavarzinia sp.]|uniref:hypothetical protein n=1 Tax=Zavarzinia sp. TaxID=2027920 RepID=UPI003561A110